MKPSFGWMLYRSDYATQHRQERILKIKLSQTIPTSFARDLFTTEQDWQRALNQGEVRYQWHPERDLWLRKLERRPIQLGIRGTVVQQYANNWILSIEDVTELADTIQALLEQGEQKILLAPEERVYEVSPEIEIILAMQSDFTWKRDRLPSPQHNRLPFLAHLGKIKFICYNILSKITRGGD
ncbi:DUF4291 family protein [Microseira sp. BLCC-F43]|uniref:DUF4291 family protein n=1 Tax=Microseira sp. BLCC-F43 TaxID=3153602 RepID=UPI0035BAFF7B